MELMATDPLPVLRTPSQASTPQDRIDVSSLEPHPLEGSSNLSGISFSGAEGVHEPLRYHMLDEHHFRLPEVEK